VTVEQIAKDFGVHPMTLFKWLRQAGQDEGAKPSVAGTDTTQISRSQHDQRLTVAAVLSRAALVIAAAVLLTM
jgi:transposase